jgi:hypothetical protein
MKKHDPGFMAGFGLGLGLAALKFIFSRADGNRLLQKQLAAEWETAIKDIKPQIAQNYHVSSFSDVMQLFKRSVMTVLEEAEAQALAAQDQPGKSSKKTVSSKHLFKGILRLDK